MTAASDGDGTAERSALRAALRELDVRLADTAARGPGACLRYEPLVERLRTPAAAFLRPDLEHRLARHVDAGDSFARDRIAHVLAGACGAAALPALLRARESDRNDDGDTLEHDLLDLFSAWPEESARLVLDCFGSADPRTRLVGMWGLAVLDFGGSTYLGMVADAASDPDPRVRADVMSTLGSIFGVGDPPRARAVLIAGTRDPAPEVRLSAVAALGSSRDETVTDLLVACADDPDRWVRFQTAWSLARRPGTTVRATLERLAADEESDVRDAARKVMDSYPANRSA
ncbi:HEAT repeat domain-containing protein [Streptomyces sp. NBC_00820]|uniref:HEAT repeat domain-containing protein n=1 Tax=Streptomyces sp. NBC_00820 TaxID=2975842 RepID=UPI002ED31BA7|nr:HEAT repeat domain-containing protein [Streptomyces sp. NBC_00820]